MEQVMEITPTLYVVEYGFCPPFFLFFAFFSAFSFSSFFFFVLNDG